MFKDEVLEVVFQGQVFGRLVAVVGGTVALLRCQADEFVVFQITQLNVDAQQLGGYFRALAQDDSALDGVFQFSNVTGP